MVIIAHINKWDLTRVLVDNSSQAEILFLSAFDQMDYNRRQLKEATKLLYDFRGKIIELVRVNNFERIFCEPWECKNIIHHVRCGIYTLSI
jgi:hypothetical protein